MTVSKKDTASADDTANDQSQADTKPMSAEEVPEKDSKGLGPVGVPREGRSATTENEPTAAPARSPSTNAPQSGAPAKAPEVPVQQGGTGAVPGPVTFAAKDAPVQAPQGVPSPGANPFKPGAVAEPPKSPDSGANAQTDRPAASAADSIQPFSFGSAPPSSDEITQGGSFGPPAGRVANLESTIADAAAAQEGVVRKFDAHTYTASLQILTEEKLASMSKPEIRAVASDRGYDDLGVGGKGSLVRRFLKAQDEHLKNSPDDLHKAGEVTHEEAAEEQAKSEPQKLGGGPSEYAEGQIAKTIEERRQQLIADATKRREAAGPAVEGREVGGLGNAQAAEGSRPVGNPFAREK